VKALNRPGSSAEGASHCEPGAAPQDFDFEQGPGAEGATQRPRNKGATGRAKDLDDLEHLPAQKRTSRRKV
jgi:hypothetical protein